PTPAQGKLVSAIVLEGLQRESRFLGEKLVAQRPVRVEDHILAKIYRVVILDDASDTNIRQSKGLCKILDLLALDLPFDQILFVNFAIEVCNGTVRSNRPGMDIYDILSRLEERDFYIRILPSFFGQDLNPEVIVFMGDMLIVVPIHLPV